MFSKPNSGNTSNYILGINIDSERTLLVYGNPSGLVSERLAFPSPSNESFATFVSEVSSNADRLLMITQALRLPLPDVISVSVAGNYDSQTGVVSSSLEFFNWKSELLRSQLELCFNLPVYAEKKADAGMLAEILFGSHSELNQAIYLTFSPHIRLSLLSEGMLYRNHGATAGALGRLILPFISGVSEKKQTLNDLASGVGLLRFAQQLHPTHWDADLNLQTFLQSAIDNDPYSLEVIDIAAGLVGKSLDSIVHILHPDTIIVGYPYHLLGERWIKPMTDSLSKASGLGVGLLPRISPSTLGARQPELEALAPAIFALRSSRSS